MSNEDTSLLFDIRRSVRYHDRRTAHFDRLHRLTNLASILLAGVVLMELGGERSPWWVRTFAVIGALLSATDLVVGFSGRANLHRNFKRRFVELEQEFHGGVDYDKLTQKRLTIEAEEPPIYRALDLLCHNEVAVSMGYDPKSQPGAFTPVPLHKRVTANWLHWSDAGYSTSGGSAPTKI